MLCCAIKTMYPFSDEIIISWVCDFSTQEILSKMMLDAYSQLFMTHSGYAVENQYFAICPPTSCIISDIFTGMEKNLNSYNIILFSHL